MTSNDCRNTRREIDELELGQRPSVPASTHMNVCVDCRKFQAERSSLRELLGSLEPVVAPPDFDMRLRARIAAEEYDQRRQPFFARLISTPALAAAALFVIVAGSVVWISRRPSNPAVGANNPEVAKNIDQARVPATVNQSGARDATAQTEKDSDVAVNPIKVVHRNRGTRSVSSEDSLVRGT